MRFIYTPLTNLATGHDTQTEYEIVVEAARLDEVNTSKEVRRIALDGTPETGQFHTVRTWKVTTDYIEVGQDTENMEEFLHSMLGGNQFVFDPDSSTPDVDVSETDCILDAKKYTPKRISNTYRTYTFKIRSLEEIT